MGDVIRFPQPMSDAEAEVDRLLGEAEDGGALTCVIQNLDGDMSLAFEPWPTTITVDGLTAVNRIMNRFRDSKEFRDALVAYSWNVGSSYVSGNLREVASH
ncbi:MAG TPA: hypothetical protein VGN60_07475 [Devosia sp.]|jgi:hypothetical protein|nr:hypothetical protein [Devosia sp.]